MTQPRWIVSRRFDLGWFFGGAAIGLGMAALHFFARAPVLLLLWIWIICFDGPHMAAGYSRTFADRETRRTKPRLLGLSLLAFAAGPLALVANLALRSPDPFQLFLGGVSIYAIYHVVRQHYGFLMLYRAKNGDRRDFKLDRACLYLGCWLPYLRFLLTHPRIRALASLPATLTWPEVALAQLLALAFALCCVAFTALALRRARAGEPTLPKLAYFLTTMLVYGVCFFVIARYEPVYAPARGPDQEFMLLFTVLSVFHSTQYVGLVWSHNHERYAAGGAAQHGLAGVISRSLPRFLLACLLFSPLLYIAVACSTGLYPGCRPLGEGGPAPGLVTWSHLGLCLWWGIALQHYYLDQKIWRVQSDATLRRSLRLDLPASEIPDARTAPRVH